MKILFSIALIVAALTSLGRAQDAKANYDSLFANVNGARIHYLKSGTGKTPLVLIHGFGDDARMWRPLFADFGKDYTIIAPDLRGLGQSSREKSGYDKKTAAVDIHELVNSLGYKEIYLVGHDIGLMVAYAYAAQFPLRSKSWRCWTLQFRASAIFGRRYIRLRAFGTFILLTVLSRLN